MILVHGLVGSAHNWDTNIEALARQRTVYALDLANMGDSERVAGLDRVLPRRPTAWPPLWMPWASSARTSAATRTAAPLP